MRELFKLNTVAPIIITVIITVILDANFRHSLQQRKYFTNPIAKHSIINMTIKLPSLYNSEQLALDSNKMLGQKYIIHVFSSWCKHCEEEQKALIKLAKELDMFVYGLNSYDNQNDAKTWLNKANHIYYNIATNNDRGIHVLNIKGVPETIIINETGQIIHHHRGPLKLKTHHSAENTQNSSHQQF